MINTLLVRWAEGWTEVYNAAAITAHGRHEALLNLGSVRSVAEVQRLAYEQLRYYDAGQRSITADLQPVDATDSPYDAFGIGDTVTVPAAGGGASDERVVALTVSEDENGQVTFLPELVGVQMTAAQRFEQAIKRMADGALGGQSAIASPVAESEVRPTLARPIASIAAPTTWAGRLEATATVAASGSREVPFLASWATDLPNSWLPVGPFDGEPSPTYRLKVPYDGYYLVTVVFRASFDPADSYPRYYLYPRYYNPGDVSEFGGLGIQHPAYGASQEPYAPPGGYGWADHFYSQTALVGAAAGGSFGVRVDNSGDAISFSAYLYAAYVAARGASNYTPPL